MKKIFSILALIFATTLASNAAGIGYMNYDIVSKNYGLSRNYNNDLNNRVKSIKTYSIQQQKVVDNAKTQTEKSKLKKAALAEIEKRQKEYIAVRDRYEIELTKRINAAAEKVRVQKKFDIILTSKSVITGGIDVTQDVINALK